MTHPNYKSSTWTLQCILEETKADPEGSLAKELIATRKKELKAKQNGNKAR